MDRIFLLYLYSRWYIAYVIQIGIENISIFEWAKFDSIVGKQALKRFDRFFIFTSYQTEDYRLRIIEDYGMSYSFSMDFGFSLKLLGFYDLASKFDLGFSLQIMDFIVASNFGFDRSLWIFIFRSKNPKNIINHDFGSSWKFAQIFRSSQQIRSWILKDHHTDHGFILASNFRFDPFSLVFSFSPQKIQKTI